MRVVIDTNVFVSAMRSSQGVSFAVLQRVDQHDFEYVVSVPLCLEYEEQLVAQSIATGHSPDEASHVVRYIIAQATPVIVYYTWRPLLLDPDDEMLVDVAIAGRADAIVTHNIRDLAPASAALGIPLLTPAEFLHIISSRRS